MAGSPWDPDSERSQSGATPDGREWKLIEKLVLSLGAEQRRARRWGIFFKLLTFFYLFALLLLLQPPGLDAEVGARGRPHTALVQVRGVIADGEEASADMIVTGLREAFENDHTRGVVLRINSPGGSPVQAGYVYDEVRRLRGEHPDIQVYAVISDIGASGAYYIAAAADQIFADKASLVGSIGVVSPGFGFVEAIDKLGVERRMLTAGEHKGMLDPFLPLDAEEERMWQEVLNTTHRQFINQVREGRGDRLKDDPLIFSGAIWSGEQAVDLGLIDGLGSTSYVAREVIGEETIVDFTPAPSPLDRMLKELGVAVGKGLARATGFGDYSLR